MAHLFVRHKVKDYPAWKKVFDGFIGTRRSGGEKNYQIFHPDNEANNVLSLFEWDNIENAKKFAHSSELKEAMVMPVLLNSLKFISLRNIHRVKCKTHQA